MIVASRKVAYAERIPHATIEVRRMKVTDNPGFGDVDGCVLSREFEN